MSKVPTWKIFLPTNSKDECVYGWKSGEDPSLENPPEPFQSWCFHWILVSAYVLLLICLHAFSPHVWIPGRLGDENWNHARDVTQMLYVQLTTCSCPYSWTFAKTGWSEFACKHINIKLLFHIPNLNQISISVEVLLH